MESSVMSSPRPTHRTRRPREPPSCQMCRVKKLKCDRQRPCSNCRTRRLACAYSRELPISTVQASVIDGDNDLQAQNEALRSRVLRLEQAVFGDDSPETASAHSGPMTSGTGESLEGKIESIANGDVRSNVLNFTVHSGDELALDAEQEFNSKNVVLPTYDMAVACLDLFETHLDAVQAITHLPGVRDMTKNMYTNLQTGVPLDPGPVSLVLAICSSMGSWELNWDFLFKTPESSSKVSTFLTKQALKTLEIIRTHSKISIEAVQASILLTFHLCQVEGMSPHTRLLHSSAVTMAQELGLHRLDVPGSQNQPPTQASIIETEVKRKVWWHLVATDWLFAYIGGRYEGAYSIHPRQMAVRKPRNLNHEDLSVEDVSFTRPADEPTVTSFHIQRIKVASICREIMDELWGLSAVPNPEELPYGKVAALDAKFHNMIEGLPWFFRYDATSKRSAKTRDDARAWQMAVQRYTINIMIHARRCKLHLPFLIHFKSDPRYEKSRETCLESAHRVFQVRRRADEEKSEDFKGYLSLGGQLSHILYAAFVLVMDLSVNKGNNDGNQAAEVHDAIQVMEEANVSSKIASSCYETLMEILRKYQVNLPSAEVAPLDALHATAVDVTTSGVDETMVDAGNTFEDVWQDYVENGSHLDPRSWEALINDLEMHIV